MKLAFYEHADDERHAARKDNEVSHRYEQSDENAVQEGYEAFNEERGEQ